MNENKNWLVHDHKKYDAALEQCELAAGAGEWKTAVVLFHSFVDDLKLHMRIEDEVLYPFFIEEIGDPHGAILDLEDEHDKIARLLHDLVFVIKNKDLDHLEESLELLHGVMRAHNDHEELVLSRLGDDSLLLRRDEIYERLNTFAEVKEKRIWEF